MKIFYLVHQFFPEFTTGTEKFVLNSALMAQKLGNRVKVITYSFYEDDYYDRKDHGILSKEFVYEGIPVLAIKYTNAPTDLNQSLHNNKLNTFANEILTKETPDVIHVGHSMRIHEFIWVAKELQIPYLITLTDFFLLCPRINLSPNSYSLCSGPHQGKMCKALCSDLDNEYLVNRLSDSKRLLLNSIRVVAPSHFVARIFNQELKSLQVDVVNHGIDFGHIKQNTRVNDPKDEIVFGYAGNIIFHKGVHVLVEAFCAIDNENIRLMIFGSGQEAYIESLQNIIENDQRVEFKGSYDASELGDVFSSIDVLVTPSLCYETYSMVLHEALASNVPVIASDLGAMREEIKNDLNGFVFRAGDVEDLREKIEKVANHSVDLPTIKEKIQRNFIVPSIEQESYYYSKFYKDAQ